MAKGDKTLIVDFTGGLWISNNTLINLTKEDMISPIEIDGAVTEEESDVIKRYVMNPKYDRIIIHVDTVEGPSDHDLLPLYNWIQHNTNVWLTIAYNIV